MNKTNVMVDLETWSTSTNAVITAIGAVKFYILPDNNYGDIVDTFYHTIQPQSCVDVGLEMSVDTILWWMKQSDDARAEFQKPALPIQDALNMFSSWLSDDPKNIDVWGNGSDFDNVILANAYKACGKTLPWRYFNNRCYRTLKNLYPTISSKNMAGVKHNALDDAKFQTNHLIDILIHINKTNNIPQDQKSKTIKKDVAKVALQPKPVLAKKAKASLLGTYNSLSDQFDEVEFQKAYNTPSGIRSVTDSNKSMKPAKEFEFIDNDDNTDTKGFGPTVRD